MQGRKSIVMQWNYILLALLQDAANMTLQSETLRRNYVRCINRKRWFKKNCQKRCTTFAMTDTSNTVQILVACVMRGIRLSWIKYFWWGRTKETSSQMKACAIYGLRFTRMNCLWLGNTKEIVSHIKVCVIEGIRFRRINCLRLGNRTETDKPDQSVCDWWHTLQMDEMFAISHNKLK